MFLGVSQTDISPWFQNQTKPITFAANSMCSGNVQSVLGGSQSYSERTHTSAGGSIPASNQLNRTLSPNFLGMACQHCFMDVGCDFQILGDTGNFAPVCSTCASFQGKQESQSSYQSVSKHKRSHACRSRGCFQQCACFEEEFLSLNFSIKEALPLVPTSQQVEVMKVIEATQTFCPDCVGPALNYSTSRTDANISGPKFFPLEFEEEEQVQSPGDGTVADSISFSSQFTRTVPSQCKSRRARRRRQRTKRHALSSDTALGLWRRVEILLPNCSRDALEKTVLQLEETVPESQVESLPRWTLDQLLNFVSEDTSMGKGAIKIAVQDVIHRLEHQPAKHVLHLRCSNVTQCRPAIISWLKTCSEDVIALQETHLCGAALREFVRKLTGSGFRVFEGEALPTVGRHSKGGLALLCRKHLATRDVGTFLLEGCGFVAAEMRTGSANVLLVSIYLQNATPASHYPNADILAQLLPLLEKWQGPWFIMGDFNLTPLEISEAGLPARSKGVVIPPSEPSMDNGNTIDMVFVSRDLAGVTTVQTDLTAPHRPHLSLVIALDLGLAKVGVLQIKQWPEYWEGEPLEGLWQSKSGLPLQGWLDEPLSTSEATLHFAAISQQLSALLGDGQEGRGTMFMLHRKPLIKPAPVKQDSAAGAWQRLSKWLEYVREDEFPENLHPAFKRLVYFLLEANPESAPVLQQTLLGLQEGVSDTQLTAVQELAEAAGKQELSSQKEGYQEWLQQAAQGSLRPIYGSIKAQPRLSDLFLTDLSSLGPT